MIYERMYSCSLLLSLSLFIAEPAVFGQLRLPDRPARLPARAVAPTRQVVAGQCGLGAIGGFAAASLALEYERFIAGPQWFSATGRIGTYLGGTIGFGGELERGEVGTQNRGFYVAPGARFHPFRNRTRADLGLGISLPVGLDIRRDNVPGATEWRRTTRTFAGALLGELTVNLRHGAPHHAIFGFFGNIGYAYSNAPSHTYVFATGYPQSVRSENDPLIVQFGLRFGGAW